MKKSFLRLLMVGLAGIFILSSQNTIKAAATEKPSAPPAPITSYVTYNTVWYDEQQTVTREIDHTKQYRTLSSFVISFFSTLKSDDIVGLSIASNVGTGNPRHCIRLLELYVKQYPSLECIKINRNCGLTPEFWQDALNILNSCKALKFLYISKDARPKDWTSATTLVLEERGTSIQTTLLLVHEAFIDDYLKHLLIMKVQPHEHRALMLIDSVSPLSSLRSFFS
jgi:hypothetical protein